MPRSRSQPSMRGSEYGSRVSYPLATSYQRATSRTDRARQPTTTVSGAIVVFGPRGIRPAVPFMPTSPLKPAGIRIEPPPSPPVAIDTSPPATAAALPPEDPPAVLPCCHGLCVTPWSLVTLTFRPPNSLAAVWPTGTAPAPRIRATWVAVWSAIRPSNTRDASFAGQPWTGSSSLIPIGTPPKGWDASTSAAVARARSRSRNGKAFISLASIAPMVASSSSAGERSPDRKASTSDTASPCHGFDMGGDSTAASGPRPGATVSW